MTERAARVVLALVVGALAGIALSTDLPRASKGQFWGDGATYHSMAWSLAEDLDLRYEAKDVFRVRREFSAGPQGIFLKRASGGLTLDPKGGFPWLRRVPAAEKRIYFAKSFAYPAAAAPLVRAFGTRGLLLTNALFLSLALVLGYAELRRGAGPAAALGATLVLYLATVAPIYLLWPSPELFNLGIIAAGLAAWRRDRLLLAALLIGLATYSKPSNLLLGIPLVLSPLVGDRGWRGLRASFVRGATLGLVVVGFYGLNAVVTGEVNYQGGERKTFYDKFPFEAYGVTFGNSGIWMRTNQIGPRVEGQTDTPVERGSEPPRALGEIRASFLRNLGYFWIGRFGGALPYFFPVVLAGVLLLAIGSRSSVAWLALTSLLASYVAYIWVIPDNWYGGSGTVGNRYFLNLLPLGVFLVPQGRAAAVALGGLLGSALFLPPLLASPMTTSLRPGDHTMRMPFRLLPAELTMLNDLAVFSELWRKKRPVGDTEGDPRRPGSADPAAYYLYFPDNGSYGLEASDEGAGFRVRQGESAEVFLRALEPVKRMTFRLSDGGTAERMKIVVDGHRVDADVEAGKVGEVFVEPPRGFVYKDTFVHVLELTSPHEGASPQEAAAAASRPGVFVQIRLEVMKRVAETR